MSDTHPLPGLREDQLLTCAEVAQAFSVTEKTVRRLERRGELIAVRIAGTVRFDIGDVRAYVRRRRRGGGR